MKKKNTVRLICLAGVMAALYVGLDFIAVSVSAPFGGNLKISLSGLPVMITAMIGGPLWGAATGFVGAFVGQLITYGMSATTLLWVLPAVIRGLSMGYLFKAFKRSLKPGILMLETCISSLLVTLFNTGAMLVEQLLYGYYQSFYAIYVAIPTRVFAGIITAVVFSLMLPTIIGALDKQAFKAQQ
jgi:ECF transporter S component (folate family)